MDEARELVERMRDVALRDGFLASCGTFGVLLGEILLRQGRFASAARIFGDSTGLLAEHDLLGWRPWALSGLARARAAEGEVASAEAALAEARRSQPIVRLFDLSHYLAATEIHVLAGRRDDAVATAAAGVDWAYEHGMPVEESFALDALVRVSPSATAADRLAELASATGNQLVGALATHARALVDKDAPALRSSAGQFAEMGVWWMAAAAATSAADHFDRKRDRVGAAESARFAASCAERCDGVRVTGAVQPVDLTPREREIALLAAKGYSNRDIAEQLVLSARTVENYLYRAYTKLGVTSRGALAEVLEP